jgi:ABC-2 type transport system permease protein
MSFSSQGVVIAANELRLTRREPLPLAFAAIPLILMVVLRPAFDSKVLGQSFAGQGNLHAVSAMTAMFGLFLVNSAGFSFYREHAWNTWHRLISCEARSIDVIAGKVVAPYITCAVQLAALLVLGSIITGLGVSLRVIPGIVVVLSASAAIVALAVLLAAIIRSVQVFVAAANLVAVMCAVVGGAILPLSLLPGWVGAIAHASPSYWTLEGLLSALKPHAGTVSWPLSCLVLVGFAVAAALLASTRLHLDADKQGSM